MITRDLLSTKDQFQELIDKKTSFLKRDEVDAMENEESWEKDRIYSHYARMFLYAWQVLILKYSIGENVPALTQPTRQAIELMKKGWKAESGYVQLVWILSIGIMLEMENEFFNAIKKLVDRDHLNDLLVDFLLKSKIPEHNQQSSKFEHPTPYKATGEIIELAQTDKDKAIERLKTYLKKEWYKGHSDSGWYDSHKSKWNVHTGYWSFESGALAKILNLDDSSLKDQQYYPYDLVHHRES